MAGQRRIEKSQTPHSPSPRPPNLAPQRDRSPELDPDLSPRLRAPARVQHHTQHAVDAEPGVPEAGVGVAFSVHLVWSLAHSRGRTLRATLRSPTPRPYGLAPPGVETLVSRALFPSPVHPRGRVCRKNRFMRPSAISLPSTALSSS